MTKISPEIGAKHVRVGNFGTEAPILSTSLRKALSENTESHTNTIHN